MKKTLLFAMLLFSAFGFSQLSMKKLNGTPINNGDVFIFNYATDPEAYFGFKLVNSSSSPINVKAELVSMTNTTGLNTQLCFGGTCVADITAGNSYPSDPAIIEANSQNGNYDHFLNLNSGADTNQIVEYVFRFYMINASNAEVGNSVSFTYRYASNLATNEFNELNNIGIQLKSNIVSNQLELNTINAIDIEIFDINGKLIDQQNIKSGINFIDVANYNSGIYFLKLIDNLKQNTIIKFIKN